MKQANTDKIKMMLNVLKKHLDVFLIGLIMPVLFGIPLILIGLDDNNNIFTIILGTLFCLPILIYTTLPSSFSYYYDKELIKKYGEYTNAVIIEKEIIDNSGYDYEHDVVDEYIDYLLTFSFEYQNKLFKSSDFVKEKHYKVLEVGDTIPIVFLTTDPNKSSIRIRKLTNLLKSNTN